MSACSTISTQDLSALWDRKARSQLLDVPEAEQLLAGVLHSAWGFLPWDLNWAAGGIMVTQCMIVQAALFFSLALTGTFTCEHLYSSKIETDPLGNFQKSLNVRLMFASSFFPPREMLRIGFLPYWLCWHWASWRALASFTAMNFPTDFDAAVFMLAWGARVS